MKKHIVCFGDSNTHGYFPVEGGLGRFNESERWPCLLQKHLAEAEHLLTDAAPVQQSLPRRWITLYLSTRRGIAETRWSAYVESSLIIGSDAAQCDLCLADGRTRPQHAVLEVESNGVTLRPLDGAAVMVNGDPIGGEYRLQNGDTIKIGRTTLRLVL